MLRGLILLGVAVGLGLVVAPFLLTSLALDERGTTISGHVFSKSETVRVHYSDWERRSEVTFRYEPPDAPGVSFFEQRLTPDEYDTFHVGDAVSLRYLRRRDVPEVPMSNFLWQMRALPMVRLAGRSAFTGPRQMLTPGVVRGLAAVCALILILSALKMFRSRLFGWVLGVGILAGVALFLVHDFPVPTPKPVGAVRQTPGRVKSLSRIDKLLNGAHSRGFIADQPVDVVGIEFVPAERTDSVLAVDLIDAGSVAGLQENSIVAIQYEANHPRNAHLQSATRDFVSRNLRGMALEAALSFAVLVIFAALAYWIRGTFRRA